MSTQQDKEIEKHERLRNEVIKELVDTEGNYVEHLRTIVELYITPIKQKNMLTAEQVATLFGNISMIFSINLELHNDLLKVKKSQPSTQNIGEIFLKMADYLRMYTQYCSYQGRALMSLSELQKTNKEFATFLETQRKDPRSERLDLGAFIIKPIQRICKYPLLLNQIRIHTPTDHFDYNNLQAALAKVTEVVADVNENKRKVENMQKIMEIQNSVLDDEGKYLKLVQPGRSFIKEGFLSVVTEGSRSKDIKYFLFNDTLLFTKNHKRRRDEFKLTSSFPLATIMVRDESGDKSFEIVSVTKAKNFIASTKTRDDKSELVEKLQELILASTKSNTRGGSTLGVKAPHYPQESGGSGIQASKTAVSMVSPLYRGVLADKNGFEVQVLGHIGSSKEKEILFLQKQTKELEIEHKKIRADYIAVMKRNANLLKKKERIAESVKLLSDENEKLAQREWDTHEKDLRNVRNRNEVLHEERRLQTMDEFRKAELYGFSDSDVQGLANKFKISFTKQQLVSCWNEDQNELYHTYSLINKLGNNLPHDLPIPEIVLIGFSGAGKSTLLESLLGHHLTFISTSTKRPVIVDIKNNQDAVQPRFSIIYLTKKGKQKTKVMAVDELSDWLQKRNDIPRPMARPLQIVYESKCSFDFKIIDTPGLLDSTASKADKLEVENIVKSLIFPSNRIIVCVMDSAVNKRTEEHKEYLMSLIGSVDPKYQRTIFTVTKFRDLLTFMRNPQDLQKIIDSNFLGSRTTEKENFSATPSVFYVSLWNDEMKRKLKEEKQGNAKNADVLDQTQFRTRSLQLTALDLIYLRQIGVPESFSEVNVGLPNLLGKLFQETWKTHKAKLPEIPVLINSMQTSLGDRYDEVKKKLEYIQKEITQAKGDERIPQLRRLANAFLHHFIDILFKSIETRFDINLSLLDDHSENFYYALLGDGNGALNVEDVMYSEPEEMWNNQIWDPTLYSGSAQLRKCFSEFKEICENSEVQWNSYEQQQLKLEMEYMSQSNNYDDLKHKRMLGIAEDKFRVWMETMIEQLFRRSYKIIKKTAKIVELTIQSKCNSSSAPLNTGKTEIIYASHLMFCVNNNYMEYVKRIVHLAKSKCLEEIQGKYLLYFDQLSLKKQKSGPRDITPRSRHKSITRKSVSIGGIEEAKLFMHNDSAGLILNSGPVTSTLKSGTKSKHPHVASNWKRDNDDFNFLLKDYYRKIRDRIVRNILLKYQEYFIGPIIFQRNRIIGVLQNKLLGLSNETIEELFDMQLYVDGLKEEETKIRNSWRSLELQRRNFESIIATFYHPDQEIPQTTK